MDFFMKNINNIFPNVLYLEVDNFMFHLKKIMI